MVDAPEMTPREEAILQATRELLVEGGVQGLTVEGVAARAGVAKTTIYRRWSSRNALALAVLVDEARKAVPPLPDLGDARQELIEFVERAVRILGTTLVGPVVRGLVSEVASDEALAAAFRERTAVPAGVVREVLERGVARGQIRDGVDAELLHELLLGPVFYRLFISGGVLDAGLARRIVDATFPVLTSPQGDGVADGYRSPG